MIKTDVNFSGIFPGHPPGPTGAEMKQDEDRAGRPPARPDLRPWAVTPIKPLLTSLFYSVRPKRDEI